MKDIKIKYGNFGTGYILLTPTNKTDVPATIEMFREYLWQGHHKNSKTSVYLSDTKATRTMLTTHQTSKRCIQEYTVSGSIEDLASVSTILNRHYKEVDFDCDLDIEFEILYDLKEVHDSKKMNIVFTFETKNLPIHNINTHILSNFEVKTTLTAQFPPRWLHIE